MKAKIHGLLDSILQSNLWFVFLFLDHPWGRRHFFNKYISYRPDFFQRYYKWKPVFGNPKKIIILKNDAIGDYLLFRNFLEEISNEYRPKGYEIHLIGNIIWKELALNLDGKFVDQFFWLNRGGLNTRPSLQSRLHLLMEVNQNTYSIVLYPNISREWNGGDWLIKHIPGQRKVGYNGDVQNQTESEHQEGNLIFNELIKPKTGVWFEFFRNREIVEILLGRKSEMISPHISFEDQDQPEGKYAVLFPGASTEAKQWPANHFSEIGKWLNETMDLRIILAGGHGDISLCEQIQQTIPGYSENLAGETSLVELLLLIRNATVLISNDTVALHMGIQSGVPSVCPFKCNHYGRFLPYPEKEFPNLRICIPQQYKILTQRELEDKFSQNYGADITGVVLEDVKKAILELVNPN